MAACAEPGGAFARVSYAGQVDRAVGPSQGGMPNPVGRTVANS